MNSKQVALPPLFTVYCSLFTLLEICMTKLVFWDVDTLYDFMKSDGKL